MKRWLSLLLAAVMVLGMLPAAVFAEEAEAPEKDKDPEIIGGYHDVDFEVSRPASQDGTTEFASLEAQTASLPAKYSSVTAGRTGAIKNQNPYGTCWAFSATTACEGGLYASTGNMEELSPLQLVNFFYNEKFDPLGNAAGDSTWNLGDTKLDQGGNNLFTMWALAGWTNGARESALPYTTENQNAANDNAISSAYANDFDVAHLQNAYIIPLTTAAEDMNNVKSAVMELGAVGVSYMHDGWFFNYENSAYYCPYDYGTNHAVAIVGWNDDYPAANFDFAPDGNGAWLIQNSWGPNWGTDGDAEPAETSGNGYGYFWLSYYDAPMLKSGAAFAYDFHSMDEYQYNYQYDGSCGLYTAYMYAGDKECAIYKVSGQTSDYESIEAVGVGVASTDASGTVYIYKNPDPGAPVSGTLVASTTFTTTYEGFYTIPIPNAPVLCVGDTFSVVIEWNDFTEVFIDRTYQNGDWITFYANTGNDHTYRISSYGTVYDGAENARTYRVKAYTRDAGEIETWDAKPIIRAGHVASTGKNRISWDAVDGAVRYNVYRAASKTGTYSLMKTTEALSYINTGAVAGKTYYYYVAAVNAAGEESQPSDIKCLVCDLAQPVVKATNVASTGYNKLTWDPINGATAYRVYRSTSRDGAYTLMKTVRDGATSYVNSNAIAGTTYYYYVVAVIEGNSSADSAKSEIKVSTCDLAQPVVKGTHTSAGRNKLTWDAVPGATGYKVYRATSKTGTYTLMKNVKDGLTSYVNTNAVVGTTYYYYVVAYLEGKDAATSAKSVIKTLTQQAGELTITMTKTPDTLMLGSSCSIAGTIVSDCNITSATAQILDSKGSNVVPKVSVTPNAKSLNIQTSALNNSLKFGSIPAAGTYTLKIVAKDASGKTVTYTKNFTVQ